MPCVVHTEPLRNTALMSRVSSVLMAVVLPSAGASGAAEWLGITAVPTSNSVGAVSGGAMRRIRRPVEDRRETRYSLPGSPYVVHGWIAPSQGRLGNIVIVPRLGTGATSGALSIAQIDMLAVPPTG